MGEGATLCMLLGTSGGGWQKQPVIQSVEWVAHVNDCVQFSPGQADSSLMELSI